MNDNNTNLLKIIQKTYTGLPTNIKRDVRQDIMKTLKYTSYQSFHQHITGAVPPGDHEINTFKKVLNDHGIDVPELETTQS